MTEFPSASRKNWGFNHPIFYVRDLLNLKTFISYWGSQFSKSLLWVSVQFESRGKSAIPSNMIPQQQSTEHAQWGLWCCCYRTVGLRTTVQGEEGGGMRNRWAVRSAERPERSVTKEEQREGHYPFLSFHVLFLFA